MKRQPMYGTKTYRAWHAMRQRWATYTQQNRNYSGNRNIQFQGITLTLIEWSEKLGIGSQTIASRLNRGWSINDALFMPSLIDRRGQKPGRVKHCGKRL